MRSRGPVAVTGRRAVARMSFTCSSRSRSASMQSSRSALSMRPSRNTGPASARSRARASRASGGAM